MIGLPRRVSARRHCHGPQFRSRIVRPHFAPAWQSPTPHPSRFRRSDATELKIEHYICVIDSGDSGGNTREPEPEADPDTGTPVGTRLPGMLHRLLSLTIGMGLMAIVSGCSSGSPTAPSGNEAPGVAITGQPQNQTIAPGNSATLKVEASGASTLSYQWFVGGAGDTAAPVQAADGSSFVTPALSSTTRFWVRVSSAGSVADSATATVLVEVGAPSIVEQPRNETITSGQTARLGVEVEGAGTFSYQWFQGTTGSTAMPLGGATASKYTTETLTDTTRYWVRVSNHLGSVDSATSTVTVSAAAPTPPPPAPAPAPSPSPAPAPAPTPAPSPVPPSVDPSAPGFEDDVLVRINQYRASGATCGSTPYPAVAPLPMNANLRAAARGHSQDMATQNYFSHTGLDGRTFNDRITAAGYTGGGPRGENIGAGYGSPSAVVAGWMSSTGHCENIMKATFRAVGVGYGYRAGSQYGHYWTITFGGS